MSDSLINQIDEDTLLVTSEKHNKEAIATLEKAMYDYTTKSNFRSAYFNEQNGDVVFTINDIDTLALNAQSNLANIQRINNIVRFFINKNDILGKVYEAIETNVNPEWDLTFSNYTDEEKDKIEEVKQLIKDFNAKIDLDKLIVDSIPMTYSEGNYIMYLRKDIKNSNYQVDYFPLGVAEIADYNEGGEPYVLINIKELESRLRKIYKKDKKNKPLFYKNIEDEIKSIYPPEVYEAYEKKEQYAILDIKNSGVMRINNLKRKYGLSPIFKSLKPVIRLENIELSDDKNTLVRGKKIIFQKLCKELVTQAKDMPNITWHSAQAKAHVDLMEALKSSGTSVYTGLPWTESVTYVEPKLEQTNVQTKNQYRTEIMNAVGISFFSADKGSFGAAEISLKELMKVINSISSQLERILKKYYTGLLMDNNIDLKYLPKIKVIDSEKLSQDIALQLIEVLYSKMNCSYETAYKLAGIDIKDEYRRRKYEQENGYEELFMPHLTSYTSNGDTLDNKGGHPADSKNLDRKEYDNDYNKSNNR